MAAALEPKPDALAPKPPLLISSEETPVYLEAFALACVTCHVQAKLKLLNRQGFKHPICVAGSQYTSQAVCQRSGDVHLMCNTIRQACQ